MIVDFFIDLWRNISAWMLSVFPADFALPDWFTGFVGTLNTFIANGANLGAWVPWAVIFTVVLACLGLWVGGFGIKAIRWLIGLIPTMGGGS